MADGFLVSVISFVFLMATISIELISFLTTHMIISTFDQMDHQGLFRRCFRQGIISIAKCIWLKDFSLFSSSEYNKENSLFTFNSEELSFKVSKILALASAAILVVLFILNLFSFIEWFKKRCLFVFMGILMMLNVFIIVALLLVYTFIYGKNSKFQASSSDPVSPTSSMFSWSYWVLYGSIPCSFIVSILYCFSPIPKRSRSHKSLPYKSKKMIDYNNNNNSQNKSQEIAKKNVKFFNQSS